MVGFHRPVKLTEMTSWSTKKKRSTNVFSLFSLTIPLQRKFQALKMQRWPSCSLNHALQRSGDLKALRIHWSELRYLDLHRRSASVNHVVTSVASAVSNCNAHKFSIARRQERRITSFAMSIAKHLIWFTSLIVTSAGRNTQEKCVHPFNIRMNGHRSDLTKKTLLSVNQHFVSPGRHSLDDFGISKIYIIDHNPSWGENQRQKRESFWIRELRTLHPEGINKKT